MKRLAIFTLILSAVLFGFSPALLAQYDQGGSNNAEPKASERKTKRTPTMREAVYKKLSEAQELAEGNDLDGALKLLKDAEKTRNLTPYEKSQIFNFYAFVYYSRDDYANAVRSYEQVLAQPDLPEALETGTIFSLAQLYFVQEQYQKSIDYLDRWFSVTTKPTAQPYLMLGQAYYQLERFNDALTPILKAVELKKASEKGVDEQSYLLLRALYFELNNYPKMAEVLEILVREFPKKDYWLQLSGVYGEMDLAEKQLITMELVYRQGLFDRSTEFVTLSQLLMQAEIPYRAAKVLADGFDQGVVDRNMANLRLLSQAYVMAQDDKKAIDPLSEAASLSKDGELYYHLANSLMNLEQYNEAASAARKALNKGGLDRPDSVRVLLGMALFENGDTRDAIEAFQQAQKDDRSSRVANQWLSFITNEQDRKRQLADAIN